MPHTKTHDYIVDNLARGFTPQDIINELKKSGWQEEEIHKFFYEVETFLQNNESHLKPAPKKSHFNFDISVITPTQILLYIGGLIIVLAGVIFIGINWENWGTIGRILATFIPLNLLFFIGIFIYYRYQMRSQALGFLVTASLVFPLFLTTFFSELKLLENNSELTAVIISALSLVLFIIMYFAFNSAIWTFFYTITGLLLHLFILMTIEAHTHLNLSNYVFYLSYLLPAAIFISLGVYYEKKGNNLFNSFPYFAGIITFFFSIASGIPESPIFSFIKSLENEHSFLMLTIGVIFLLTSFILEKAKDYQLPKLAKYHLLYSIAGLIIFMVSLLELSFNGKKPVYETLVLLASLGFIFGSVYRQSKIFLYGGSIFLVIYIFDIGGEYFQNAIGWPLTLFIIGLTSMFAGVAIDKMKKKYFGKKITAN